MEKDGLYSSPWLDKFEKEFTRIAFKLWKLISYLWKIFYEKVIRDIIYRKIVKNFLFEKVFRKLLGIRGITTIFETDLENANIFIIPYRLIRWLAGKAAPFAWKWFTDGLRLFRSFLVLLIKDVPLQGYNLIKRLIFVFNIPINLTTTLSSGIFVILFVFIDRNYVKNLKYPKLYEPNIFWRFLMFMFLLFQTNRFIIPVAEIAFQNDFWWIQFSPVIDLFFDEFDKLFEIIITQLPLGMQVYNTIVDPNTIEGVDIVQFFGFFAWLFVRASVQSNLDRKIPFFVLSMFIRYHLTSVTVLVLVFSSIETMMVILGGLEDGLSLESWPANIIQVVFFFLPGMTEGKMDPIELFNIYCAKLHIIAWLSVGPSLLLKAILGRTFDNSWYDPLLQASLGYECLYNGERWGEYGLSDTITGAKSYYSKRKKAYPPGFFEGQPPGWYDNEIEEDEDDEDDNK